MANVKFTWNDDPDTESEPVSYTFLRSDDGGNTYAELETAVVSQTVDEGLGIRSYVVEDVPNGPANFGVIATDEDGEDSALLGPVGFAAEPLVPSMLGPLELENV